MCLLPCYPRARNFASTCYGHFCHCVQGFGFLCILLVYQLLNFIVVVSVSVGLTVLISAFFDLCTFDTSMRSDAQAIITLLFISTQAECTLLIVHGCSIGNWFKAKTEKWPFIVGRIPMIIYAWLFILACTQLFIQYKVAHPSPFFHPEGHNKSVPEVQQPMSNSLDQTVTFIFLLSLTYIAYVTSRFSDWVRYRCRLSNMDRMNKNGSCGAYLFYLWVQVILLYLYGVPVFVAAALCKFSAMAAHTTFMVINFGAIVIGYNVVQIESSKPFPTVSLLPPEYRYESHLCARANVLQYALFPLVAFCYYGSGKAFEGLKAEDKFIIYTICVGLTTLQVTKVIFDVRFMDAIRKLRLLRQQQQGGLVPVPEQGGNNDPVPPPNQPRNAPLPAPAPVQLYNIPPISIPVPGPSASAPPHETEDNEKAKKKPEMKNNQPEGPDVNQNQNEPGNTSFTSTPTHQSRPVNGISQNSTAASNNAGNPFLDDLDD